MTLYKLTSIWTTVIQTVIKFTWKFSVHSPVTKLTENSERFWDKHLGRKVNLWCPYFLAWSTHFKISLNIIIHNFVRISRQNDQQWVMKRANHSNTNNCNTRIASNRDYKSRPIIFGYAWLCAAQGTWNLRIMIMFHNTYFYNCSN